MHLPDIENDDPIKAMVARVRSGLYEEMDLVSFIYRYLLHPEQALWLEHQKLTVMHLLNGKFNDEQEPTIVAIFADWNLKCGTRLFRLHGGEDE